MLGALLDSFGSLLLRHLHESHCNFDPVARACTPSDELIASDPVHEKEIWHRLYASPWNDSTLTTAGNLVFQARPTGGLWLTKPATESSSRSRSWEPA